MSLLISTTTEAHGLKFLRTGTRPLEPSLNILLRPIYIQTLQEMHFRPGYLVHVLLLLVMQHTPMAVLSPLGGPWR